MRARRRLLATLLLALLLPGALVAALAAWARVHAGREQSRALAALATASQASLLRERLDLAAARLATVASLWPAGAEQTAIRDALLPVPGFWALRLEGPKGLLEWQDEARLAGEGPGATAYADALRAGFPALRSLPAGTDPVVLPVERAGRTALAVVVRRGDGTVAVGELPASWLRVPASAGLTSFVVDAGGRPLATEGDADVAQLASLPPVHAATSAAAAGAFTFPDGAGGSTVCSFAAVGRGGLAVIRLHPQRPLVGSMLAEVEPAALLLAGLSILLVLIAVLVSGSLARPLEELGRVAGKIAAGELGTNVGVAEGELGVAAAALRKLQRAISERDSELDRQSTRLVELSRRAAAGELAVGIAGSARAPLQGVLSYADVGAAIAGEDDPRLLFEEIRLQAARAAGVVEELVAVAEGGKAGAGVVEPGGPPATGPRPASRGSS